MTKYTVRQRYRSCSPTNHLELTRWTKWHTGTALVLGTTLVGTGGKYFECKNKLKDLEARAAKNRKVDVPLRPRPRHLTLAGDGSVTINRFSQGETAWLSLRTALESAKLKLAGETLLLQSENTFKEIDFGLLRHNLQLFSALNPDSKTLIDAFLKKLDHIESLPTAQRTRAKQELSYLIGNRQQLDTLESEAIVLRANMPDQIIDSALQSSLLMLVLFPLACATYALKTWKLKIRKDVPLKEAGSPQVSLQSSDLPRLESPGIEPSEPANGRTFTPPKREKRDNGAHMAQLRECAKRNLMDILDEKDIDLIFNLLNSKLSVRVLGEIIEGNYATLLRLIPGYQSVLKREGLDVDKILDCLSGKSDKPKEDLEAI